ncbi:WG repeat-containing protein [Sphingobacterium sp. SRCM116780]|uniref:WG repeat-containing protein n=1 Tax=Sphingobacterium sp. SRCM116780 TaxID=2907623 RepID=UPI001F4699C5|nr:WG repeat-containing protein [Sphingobacterium sp. SRCM116780]UIR56814.1 WG repeat-containing protein [Sphingobacterium sp. SRCM116780]
MKKILLVVLTICSNYIFGQPHPIASKIAFNGLFFEEAMPYYEHRALVSIDGKYKYIDTMGNFLPYSFIRNSEFEVEKNFENGRAKVHNSNLKNIKYGYIDLSGKLIVDYQYDYATPFSDSLAVVKNNHFFGYIDIHGNAVLKNLNYDILTSFHENIAIVYNTGKTLSSDFLYGAINKKRELIIPLEFNRIDDFKEGYAIAQKEQGGQFGVIDKNGKFVIRPKYELLQSFSEGLAAFMKDDKWGFIDIKGNVIVKPIYDEVRDFSEGLAAVSFNDKYGFIDKKGNVVIDLKFNIAHDFLDGMALTSIEVQHEGRIKELYGFIDKKGDWYYQPIFKDARGFTDGFAAVKFDGQNKWQYITK